MDNQENPLEGKKIEEIVEIVSLAFEPIPYVGGFLASSASYYIQQRKNARLNDFLLDLAERVSEIQEYINQDFVSTDDFNNLVEEILEAASQTRQNEKLEAFRTILINTITQSHPNYDEALEICRLVQKWEPRHIEMLKIFWDPRSADEQMGNILEKSSGSFTSIMQIFSKLLPDWSQEQIERTLQDLYTDHIHGTTHLRTTITDKGFHQIEGRITDFGKRVSKYIINPDNIINQ